jgi:hypothetical protein
MTKGQMIKHEPAIDPRVEDLLEVAISLEQQGMAEEAEELREEARDLARPMAQLFVRFGGMI